MSESSNEGRAGRRVVRPLEKLHSLVAPSLIASRLRARRSRSLALTLYLALPRPARPLLDPLDVPLERLLDPVERLVVVAVAHAVRLGDVEGPVRPEEGVGRRGEVGRDGRVERERAAELCERGTERLVSPASARGREREEEKEDAQR